MQIRNNKEFTKTFFEFLTQQEWYPSFLGWVVVSADGERIDTMRKLLSERAGVSERGFKGFANFWIDYTLSMIDYAYMLDLIVNRILGHSADE